MKRFLAAFALVAVAAAMSVAVAEGGHKPTVPSMRQFNALKKQVTVLSKHETGLKSKVSSLNEQLAALTADEGNVKTVSLAAAALVNACVAVAVPIDEFGDAANQTEGYNYTFSDATTGLTTALDVAPTTDTGAVWFVGGTSTCGTDLGESTLRHAAARAGVALPHVVIHPAFVAHRR